MWLPNLPYILPFRNLVNVSFISFYFNFTKQMYVASSFSFFFLRKSLNLTTCPFLWANISQVLGCTTDRLSSNLPRCFTLELCLTFLFLIHNIDQLQLWPYDFILGLIFCIIQLMLHLGSVYRNYSIPGQCYADYAAFSWVPVKHIGPHLAVGSKQTRHMCVC